VYGWNIEKDEIKSLYTLPKEREFYGLQGDFVILEKKSSYRNIIYTLWNTKTNSHTEIETGRGGSLIYVDDDIICYRSRSENKLIAQSHSGDILWSFEIAGKADAIYTWYSRARLIVPLKSDYSRQIIVIDVLSGREVLSYDITDVYQYSISDESRAYLKTKNHLIVYDDSKKSIIFDKTYKERVGNIKYHKDKLYVILENPIQIEVYNIPTMELLVKRQLVDFRGRTGLFATSNSRHLLAIYPEVLEEKRGLTWMCYFTDDELFSEDWQVDFEPAYYSVEEQDDFSGGVSLNVTFDTNIDFDTLYRHVSTGLQTAAFRNGIHRFTEGKSYNERFNGTVIANFEGHDFTEEQRELIEDLCERTTQYFHAGMSLLSGDGSQVCHVTSIIPTPHAL
jgi:hypothetical protein